MREKLLERLRNNDPNLTILELMHSHIGDEGVHTLSKALKYNTTLTALDLNDNEIGEKGICALSKALKLNTSLTELELECNNTEDEGTRTLSAMLEYNTTLTILSLINNRIGEKGICALSKALKLNTSLTELDLRANNIENKDTYALSQALKCNTSLTKLNLGSNNIGDEEAIMLSVALNHNTTLKILYLNFNNIGIKGIRALSNSLKRNTSLTLLNLGKNNIGDEGTANLSEALKYNISLTDLDLYSCNIGYEGATMLSIALNHNTTLTTLRLDFNDIGIKGIRALSDSLEYNTSLTRFSLLYPDGNIISKFFLKISEEKIKLYLQRNRDYAPRRIKEEQTFLEAPKPKIKHIKKFKDKTSKNYYHEKTELPQPIHVEIPTTNQIEIIQPSHLDEKNPINSSNTNNNVISENTHSIKSNIPNINISTKNIDLSVGKLKQIQEFQNSDIFISPNYIEKIDNLDARLKDLENNQNDATKKLTEIENNQKLIKELNISLPELDEQIETAKKLKEELKNIPSLTSKETAIVKVWCAQNEKDIQELEQIQDNPNLQVYYNRLQIRLEELFMAHKVRSTGLVDPKLFKANITSLLFDLFGIALESVPVINMVPKLISKANLAIASTKATENSRNISVLMGTWCEQQTLAESIARYLTLRYQAQIIKLMTSEEMEMYERKKRKNSKAERIKQGVTRGLDMAKEELINQKKVSPCIEAAEFVMGLILVAFHDEKIKDPEEAGISIEEQIARYILKPLGAIDGAIDKFLSIVGARTVLTKDEQEWILLEMYQKPGIETEEGEIYSNKELHNQKKYGFRQGTEEEIGNLRKRNRHDNIIIEVDNIELKETVSVLQKEHKKLEKVVNELNQNNFSSSYKNSDIDISINGNDSNTQIQAMSIKQRGKMTNPHLFFDNEGNTPMVEEIQHIKTQVTKLTYEVVGLKERPYTFNQRKRPKKNPIIINQGNNRLSDTKQDIIRALRNYIEKKKSEKGPFLFFISRSQQSLKFLEDKIALAENIINNIDIAENLNEIKCILEDGIESDAVLCRTEGTTPNTLTAILSQFLNGRVQRNLKPSLEDSSYSL